MLLPRLNDVVGPIVIRLWKTQDSGINLRPPVQGPGYAETGGELPQDHQRVYPDPGTTVSLVYIHKHNPSMHGNVKPRTPFSWVI